MASGYFDPITGSLRTPTTAPTAPQHDVQATSGYTSPRMGESPIGAAPSTDSVGTPHLQATPAPALPEFSYDLGGVNPTNDLIYQSMLRGAGFDRSSAQAQAAYARQQLQSQLQAQIPLFAQQQKEGIVNEGEAAAARGAARSSSRLQAQNDVVSDTAQRESAFRAGIADKQAQLSFGLQDQLNQIDRQKAEAEIEARQRLVEDHNKQIAYQRALMELGL